MMLYMSNAPLILCKIRFMVHHIYKVVVFSPFFMQSSYNPEDEEVEDASEEEDEEYDEEEDDEDDDDDDSESSEGEEPKLKYERIRNTLERVLSKDAASCMAVHSKVGTLHLSSNSI